MLAYYIKFGLLKSIECFDKIECPYPPNFFEKVTRNTRYFFMALPYFACNVMAHYCFLLLVAHCHCNGLVLGPFKVIFTGKFSVPRIEYPVGGSSKKVVKFTFMLIVAIVLLL